MWFDVPPFYERGNFSFPPPHPKPPTNVHDLMTTLDLFTRRVTKDDMVWHETI